MQAKQARKESSKQAQQTREQTRERTREQTREQTSAANESTDREQESRQATEADAPIIKRGIDRKRSVTSRRPRMRVSKRPSDLMISNTSSSLDSCADQFVTRRPHLAPGHSQHLHPLHATHTPTPPCPGADAGRRCSRASSGRGGTRDERGGWKGKGQAACDQQG